MLLEKNKQRKNFNSKILFGILLVQMISKISSETIFCNVWKVNEHIYKRISIKEDGGKASRNGWTLDQQIFETRANSRMYYYLFLDG